MGMHQKGKYCFMKKSEKSGKRKRGVRVLSVLMMICIVIAGISGYKLYSIMHNYHQSNEEYEEIENSVTKETKQGYTVDFSYLQSQNPDCIGWIRFEHLNINYPIMQGEDNDYYLHHTLNGSYLYAGSIFMNYQNKKDFSDMNTFIFGHNMKNDSMFGLLGNFKNKETFRENPYFWIYTSQAAYRYDIFSCFVADADEDTYTVYHEESDAYRAYIEKLKANSAYDTGVEVDGSDHIVTLSTCTSEGYDYRYIVTGVLAETIPQDKSK